MVQRRGVTFKVPEGGFSKETHRWNELMEATLCYGIHCLSSNYNLHSLNVREVQSIAGELLKAPRAYHVRKPRSNKPGNARRASESPTRRPKPPSNWRDGEETHILEPLEYRSDDDNKTALRPKSKEPGAGKREADCYAGILGDKGMEEAWKAFNKAGYPTHPVDGERALSTYACELAPKMAGVNEAAPRLSPNEKQLSFSGFVKGYLQHVVHTANAPPPMFRPPQVQEKSSAIQPPVENIATSTVKNSQEGLSNSRPEGAKKPKRKKNKKLGKALPEYLQDVKSKVGPKVKEHRNQVLRVRKNQSQKLKESIARKRLQELEELKRLRDEEEEKYSRKLRRDPLEPKKGMPGDHKGASALEIANSFVGGDLLEKFSKLKSDDAESENGFERPDDNVEIYGSREFEDSKGYLKNKGDYDDDDNSSSDSNTVSRPAYTGWVGDFGPSHTHSLKAQDVWDFKAEDDEDEVEDGFFESKYTEGGAEWDFNEIEKAAERRFEEQQESERAAVAEESAAKWNNDVNITANSFNLSNVQKEEVGEEKDSGDESEQENFDVGTLEFESDPAFAWLKQ